MTYEEMTGRTIESDFNDFHRENPQVFEAFKSQALRAIEKGRKKISAKLIINWIRWNKYLEKGEGNFKINDAFQSYYARLFIKHYPEHADKFELRKQRSKEQGPYAKVDKNGQFVIL